MRQFTSVFALVAALLFAAHARAATSSVVQTLPFAFNLYSELDTGEAVPQITPLNLMSGSQDLYFNPFNTSLGDLVEVQLDLDMTISGLIPIYYALNPASEAPQIDEEFYIDFYGDTIAESLIAIADFGPYVIGVDGIPTQDGLLINEHGTGSDGTTDLLDLPSFINNNPVLAEVYAAVALGYPQARTEPLVDGQPAYGLMATGDVKLTYIYSIGDTVVPSPAALPAGLALLSLMGLRRRRAA